MSNSSTSPFKSSLARRRALAPSRSRGDPEHVRLREFRRLRHLRPGYRASTTTPPTGALDGVLRHYQKQDRLEAEINLANPETCTYAAPGPGELPLLCGTGAPLSTVLVDGADQSGALTPASSPSFRRAPSTTISSMRRKSSPAQLLPAPRLLHLRPKLNTIPKPSRQRRSGNPLPRSPWVPPPSSKRLRRRKSLLRLLPLSKSLLTVHLRIAAPLIAKAPSAEARSSPADVSALQSVYRENGFSNVKVVPETSTPETVAADNPSPESSSTAAPAANSRARLAPLATIVYRITEEKPAARHPSPSKARNSTTPSASSLCSAQHVHGQVALPEAASPEIATPCSPISSSAASNIPKVDITQKPQTNDPTKVDVVFHLTQGDQVFVRKVFLTGLHFTRPETVAKAITHSSRRSSQSFRPPRYTAQTLRSRTHQRVRHSR